MEKLLNTPSLHIFFESINQPHVIIYQIINLFFEELQNPQAFLVPDIHRQIRFSKAWDKVVIIYMDMVESLGNDNMHSHQIILSFDHGKFITNFIVVFIFKWIWNHFIKCKISWG